MLQVSPVPDRPTIISAGCQLLHITCPFSNKLAGAKASALLDITRRDCCLPEGTVTCQKRRLLARRDSSLTDSGWPGEATGQASHNLLLVRNGAVSKIEAQTAPGET